MKSHQQLLSFALAFAAALTYTACTDDAPGEDLAAPEMTTDGANNVARTSCTVAGRYSGNLSKISEYGVKYSTSNNFPTDATTYVTFDGQPGTSVKAELENLSPNTHYYYCWYASTGKTVVTSTYGEFTTTSTAKPEFSEITVDSLSENYARLRCRVTEVGDQYLVEQGISYRAKTATANYTQVAASQINSNYEYTVELLDLTSATTYEIRPYAKNSADAEGASGMLEGYGDTQTITTDNKVSPELDTYDATDITMNSARVLAMVTSAESSYGVITERGFCYSSTSQAPTIYDKTVVVNGLALNEVYEATLTDLDQLTTYYVRPYAKNLVDWQERVGYGPAIEFTTSRFTAPQVSFTNSDDATVATTTIKVQAQIDNYYPTVLVERGFIWSADDKNITIDNAKSVGNYLTVDSSEKVFTGTLTNLNPSTNYYIRAYAIYQASGETLSGVSEVVSYTTNEVTSASFKDVTCTDKTISSLTLATGINDMGDGVLDEKGFVWRLGSGVAVTLDNCDGSQAVPGEDSYNYSATLSGLRQATGYTVRGYVKTLYNWTTLIAYSDALYCETNDFIPATLTDITATAQTVATVTVQAGISDMGNGKLVEKGFVWRIGENVTPSLTNYDGTQVATDENNSSYTTVLNGLATGTTYSIRAYAKTTLDGQEVVAYSNTITSATNDYIAATLKSITCTAQTMYTLTVESGIADLGNGEFEEKGFLWKASSSGTPTLENCDGSVKAEGTDRSSFSVAITGLESGTPYRLRAYTKTTLEGITIVGYSDVVTGTTKDRVSATMKSVSANLIDDCTLSASSGISSLGTGELIEKGFCWKAGDVPTLEDCDGSTVVNDGTADAYSTSISNLHYNTSYYIRSYAITEIEGETVVSYSSYTRQSTVTITLDYTVTNVSDSYIQLSLSCSDYYADQLTAFDAAVIKVGNEEVTPSSYTSATKDETGSTYSVKIENLTSYTDYVILLRAKHKGGYYITQETGVISTAKKPSKDDINLPSVKF